MINWVLALCLEKQHKTCSAGNILFDLLVWCIQTLKTIEFDYPWLLLKVANVFSIEEACWNLLSNDRVEAMIWRCSDSKKVNKERAKMWVNWTKHSYILVVAVDRFGKNLYPLDAPLGYCLRAQWTEIC